MTGSTKAKKRRRRRPVTVAGWREWVSLPDLAIPYVKAKLDTGARSSALHAFAIEKYEIGDRSMVRFKVRPIQRDTSVTVESTAELIDERNVRDSGGRVEKRPVIRTTLALGGNLWPIEVTLSRRDKMGFRMLLGRQALKRRYVVDPGASFTLGAGPTTATQADEEE